MWLVPNISIFDLSLNSLHDAFGTWSFKIFYQKFCLSSPECQQFGLFRCGSIPNFSHPYPALSWSYPVLGPCHPLGQICPLSTHFFNLIFLFGQIHTFKNSDSVFFTKIALQNSSQKWPHVILGISWNNAMIQFILWGWIIATL